MEAGRDIFPTPKKFSNNPTPNCLIVTFPPSIYPILSPSSPVPPNTEEIFTLYLHPPHYRLPSLPSRSLPHYLTTKNDPPGPAVQGNDMQMR